MKYALAFALVAVLVLAHQPTAEADTAPENQDACVPGEQFARDCNTCTCPPSGLKSVARCTLKLCD